MGLVSREISLQERVKPKHDQLVKADQAPDKVHQEQTDFKAFIRRDCLENAQLPLRHALRIMQEFHGRKLCRDFRIIGITLPCSSILH
jgi:hypothetical protein